MKKWLAALLMVIIMSPSLAQAKKSKKDDAAKTESVSGYTTKKGKHVDAYNRRPAGTVPKNEKKK